MLKNIFLSLTNIILITGCAELSAGTGSVSTHIEGHEWKLVSFGDNSTIVTDKATLSLKDGHYSGWSGCNAMSGTYLLNRDKLTFDANNPFHSGVSTMMACSNMELETKYYEAIRKVDHYKIEGGQLILLKGNHKVLIFADLRRS